MAPEIKGQDWNKEIITSKDAVNGGPSDVKRTEFYEKRSDLKTADVFNDVVGDLTGKGYKTLDDLRNTNVLHEIKPGNTLFPILKDYFAALPGMTPDQAQKETYLSLAFVMKENPGINVDDLKVGGKVVISDGYLTVINPDGTTKTIDMVPLRPAGVIPAVPSVPIAPSPVAPQAPAVPPAPIVVPEPVAPVAPKVVDDTPPVPVTPEVVPPVLEPVVPAHTDIVKDQANKDQASKVEQPPVVSPDVQGPKVDKPANPDSVVFLPEEPKPEVKIDILAPSVPTYGPISKIDDVAVHTEVAKDDVNKVEAPAESTPELTAEQINSTELVSGKVTWEGGSISVGTFRGGNQVDGTWTSADGKEIQTGVFWETGDNFLKNGSKQTPTGQESGSFNEKGELIDGVRVVDGKKEFVGLERTITEIQDKVATLKLVPRKGFETDPYKVDGANIIFQNEKSWYDIRSDKPIYTVESPEKAAVLVAVLNTKYLPTAPVTPAEKPAPVVETAPNESQKTLDFVKNTLKLKDAVALESIQPASVTIDGVVVEGSQFDYKGGKILISKDQKDVYFDLSPIDLSADVDQQIIDILSAR